MRGYFLIAMLCYVFTVSTQTDPVLRFIAASGLCVCVFIGIAALIKAPK